MIKSLKREIAKTEARIHYRRLHFKLQYTSAKKRFFQFLHTASIISAMVLIGML